MTFDYTNDNEALTFPLSASIMILNAIFTVTLVSLSIYDLQLGLRKLNYNLCDTRHINNSVSLLHTKFAYGAKDEFPQRNTTYAFLLHLRESE